MSQRLSRRRGCIDVHSVGACYEAAPFFHSSSDAKDDGRLQMFVLYIDSAYVSSENLVFRSEGRR